MNISSNSMFCNKEAFDAAVREKHAGACVNCFSKDKVSVRMVVPESAGGVLSLSNGVTLCLRCDMARESIPSTSIRTDSFVVSIWMSNNLRNTVEPLLNTKKTFRSWSALSRYLISKYVLEEDVFWDLDGFRDLSSETKVTIRVEKSNYDIFAAKLKKRGITVTDGLKGLYMMYAHGPGIQLGITDIGD